MFEFARFANRLLFVLLITCLIILNGCSSAPNQAPVTSSAPISSYRLTTHVVSPGETLYGIAWRYNLDFKALAAANQMSVNNPLRVGQKLTLDTTNVRVQTTPKKTISKQRSGANKKHSQPRNVSADTSLNKPVSKTWLWPLSSNASADRISRSSLNKALDIDGRLGESVIAAQGGKVVYAGDGLRGYGNLIIIKHNDQWLSAYGNNRQILVKEGQTIKAGATIAELGVDDSNRSRLHFEIRKNGAPVDPKPFIAASL